MTNNPIPPRPWFRAKRLGYGAGWPMAWQGWALLLAYLAVVTGFMVMIERTGGGPNWAAYAGVGLATLLMLWIAAAHTEGGWRWRWGKDDVPPPPPNSEKPRRRSRRHS